MIKISVLHRSVFAMLILAAFTFSCNNDDEVTINDGSDPAINNWVYDVMKEVYYWTDQIPTTVNKNQDPGAFFETLTYKDDRFSIIVPDYDALVASLNGVYKEAGYEYDLFYADDGNHDLIAVISYVKPNSPAFAAGLKRGDVIQKISGETITLTNYQSLLSKLSSNHSLTFSRDIAGDGEFILQPDVNLSVVELAENPSYLDSVYTIDGHKIGYFVYNFFSPGVVDKEYDQGVDAVFADFKSKGITDLILDFRYNNGGAISSATNLASLVGKNVGPDKIFYENRWNDFYQDYIEKDPEADDILRGKFLAKAENLGNNLVGGKVYMLIGQNTASASELVINGLKPYMEVVLIGETTVGKNVGSIPIEDEKNTANNYGLLPIAFRVFNSDGNSDYAEGFDPDIEAQDYAIPMKPLGDIEETLLAVAISDITGQGGVTGKFNRGEATMNSDLRKKSIMSSLDNKVRKNRLILDKK